MDNQSASANGQQDALPPLPDDIRPEDLIEKSQPVPPPDRERMQAFLDPHATPVDFPIAALDEPQISTHQLPALETVLLRPWRGLRYGHRRDIGRVRTENEDSTFTFFTTQLNAEENPDLGIFIVADGAGGHENGELASAVVSRAMIDVLTRLLYQPMLLQHLDKTEESIPPITELLTEAVKDADKRLRDEVPGAGSTLTTVVVMGDLAHIAHVGDSRAYLLTPLATSKEEDAPTPADQTPAAKQEEDAPPFKMEQLTRDHSVAKRLEEIGQITAREAVNHPEAGRLWKIMGLTDNLEPDISTRRLPAHSYLLMCSDGLWNMLSEADMARIITSAGSPQEAVDRLIVSANAYGGVDNISAIVLQMP